MPDVPLKFMGIEVCDHVAIRWDKYEGSMWRMGVANAIDAMTKAAQRVALDLKDDGCNWFPDEWSEGRIAGKESAAEDILDMLSEFKDTQ